MSRDQGTNWRENEFSGADFGDPRLTKRLIQIANKLANNPQASIPQACETWMETKATYRFLDNDKVNEHNLQEPHQQATYDRAQRQATVLAVQDTTQLDFTHHPSTQGLGMLNDQAHQGFFYHPTLLVTPEKVPLGIIDHQVWERPQEDFGKSQQRKQKPISEKESQKWLHSLDQTAQRQEALPQVQVVNIADREADIYDYLQLAQARQIEVLVRAAHNRRVDQPEKYLWDHMAEVPVSQYLTIAVPRKPGQAQREAVLSIRYSRVALQPPRHRYQEKDLPPVTVWVVYAHEADPPAGLEAISWMLLTTLPVHNAWAAMEKVQWYTCRWQIELFFKVLKSGCRIERLQLETAARLRRGLALYAVIAWQVLFLTMQSREVPNMPCDILLEVEEWQALYCYIHNTASPPKQPPTLLEATRMIARLGGFLGRKSDGYPGATTIWRGLQRLHDIAAAWSLGRQTD